MAEERRKKEETSLENHTSYASAIQQPPQMQESGNLADNWKDWKKTFDWYLIAAGREKASDREKCALFLHVIGKAGRDLYDELDLDADIKYTVLCEKFDNRCNPQKNVNFERHVFFETYQKDEDFDRYLALLKIKSKSCDFGDLKESLLLTQLIRGIKDGHIRESMLRRSELKLSEAVMWCQAAEIASQQASVVKASASGSSTSAGGGSISAEIENMNARPGMGRGGRGTAGAGRSYRPGPPPPPPRRPQRGHGQAARADSNFNRPRCWNCGNKHGRNECPAYNMRCFQCNKMGHFEKCCRSGFMREMCQQSDEDSDCEDLIVNDIAINSLDGNGWYAEVFVNGVPVNFKLDSGADACVMSHESFIASGFNKSILKHTGTILREVSKNILPVVGYFNAELYHDGKKCEKKIYVLNVKCSNLLSRDVCSALNLIIRVNELVDKRYCELLNKYSNIFKGIGRLPGTHKLTIDKTVPPVVRSTRKIPIKLKPKLKEELDRLTALDIIERVDEPTDWVSNIVLVEKPDGKIRLCMDPQHLNKAIKRSHFQLPTLDEITSNLSGAKYFTHLDASKAFFMIVLDESSSKLCTFATPFGRYKFLRLPFGICSASEVFHSAMYNTFDMVGVEIFVDDILVYGSTREEHDSRLEAVLKRAAERGVRFNRDKCIIGATEVKYLGHVFSEHGMRPDNERIKAVKDMPSPTCRKELERFLGSSYCNATFDGYLCWPPARAGQHSYQLCPPARLSDPSRLAFRRCGESGLWLGKRSDEINLIGWTNYTPCFPSEVQTLLVKVYDDNETDAQLKFEVAQWTRYLEIVGFSISLIALIISLVIFSHYRSLRNNRTRIHKSLFTAMVLQVCIRLTLYIDQAFIRSKHGDHYPYDNITSYSPVRGIDNMPYLCESSYVLLEYAITVMFMWMFIEGLYLHNVVTANALRERISHLMFYATGWGLPVIVTFIWATTTAIHYQKESVKQCWYGYNFSQLYWIVQGPRLAVILINLVFLLNIMRVLIVKLRRSENTEVEKVRKAVRAALVLLPLLGITNVLNMTEAPLDGNVWKFRLWSYGTHFLRSFQGFFISLIYCFLNGEVRLVVKKHYDNYMAMRIDTRRHRDSLFHFMSSSGENRQPRPHNNESEQTCFPLNTLRLTAPASSNDGSPDAHLRAECSKQNDEPEYHQTAYSLNTLSLTAPANFNNMTSDTNLGVECEHEAE